MLNNLVHRHACHLNMLNMLKRNHTRVYIIFSLEQAMPVRLFQFTITLTPVITGTIYDDNDNR